MSAVPGPASPGGTHHPSSSDSVVNRALRGVPWTLTAFAVSRGVQLIGTLVIARLIPPHEIGVVFTGLLIINAFNLISDNGLSISLVVRERVTTRLVNTVFTLMMGLAVTCVVIVWTLKDPISKAFGSPRLADVLPLLSLTIVTSTITWFYTNMLQREMLWRRRFAGQFALAVGYVAVAVPCAALGAGVWSMVAGQLAAGLASNLVLWRAYPHSVRPGFHKPEARAAVSESRPFMLQAASSFFIENMDFIAVSSILGPAAMAIYTMAYRLTQLPYQALVQPVSEATLPAYARLRDDPARSASTMLGSLRAILLVALLPLGLLAASASDFVAVILGPHWEGTGPVLAILCIWGAESVAAGMLGWYMMGSGAARFMGRINLVRFVIVVPLIFTAVLAFSSLELVAGVLSLDVGLEMIVMSIYAHHRLHVHFQNLWAAVRTPAAATVAAVGATLAARFGLADAGVATGPRFAVELVAGGATYVGLALLLDHNAINEMRALARRAMAREPAS